MKLGLGLSLLFLTLSGSGTIGVDAKSKPQGVVAMEEPISPEVIQVLEAEVPEEPAYEPEVWETGGLDPGPDKPLGLVSPGAEDPDLEYGLFSPGAEDPEEPAYEPEVWELPDDPLE